MDDGSWQDNLSDYNSDFSMPSDQEDGKYIFFSNYTLTLFTTGGAYFYPLLILGAPNDDGPITIHDSSCPSTKKKIEKQFREIFLQSLKILCFQLHFRFHYETTMQAM